ncbi:MAG: hypothetical protein ACRD4J_08430 [Nitrososphaeraceae archaeon]
MEIVEPYLSDIIRITLIMKSWWSGRRIMVIEWDIIIVEMSILAGIIYFSAYLEHWTYNRSQKKEDEKIKQNITRFIENDIQQRLNFINESLQ